MNLYPLISKLYDILDLTYFSNKEKNPREAVNQLIPDREVKILDMCCGTLSNSIPIARKKKNAKILGIDITKQMLWVAQEKINREKIENIHLRCLDATNTDMKADSFDYIVIGLALHEMNSELQGEILTEAYRLLKSDGKLIILEWEKPERFIQKALYFPLLAAEQGGCASFLNFYRCNKEAFFSKYGFHTCKKIHCSYTIVLELEKHIDVLNSLLGNIQF